MTHQVKIRHDWLSLGLILVVWGFGLFNYSAFPQQIPSHWNLQGQVDGTTSRFWGVGIMPLLPLAIYVLMTYLPKLDPKKANYEKFTGPYYTIRMAITLSLSALSFIVMLSALGYAIDVSLFVRILLSALFIVIGNYMGKVRHNYFLGYRTPWSLASEDIWNKTHRLGGKLQVAGGILALTSIFLPTSLGATVFLFGLLGPVFLTFIYSYLLYKRQNMTKDIK